MDMVNYNFDNIGKKMPYRVPDGFFDDMEDSITSRALSYSKKNLISKILYWGVASAAAIAALIIVAIPGDSNEKTEFADIAQAFDNLSDADQAYLIEIYQDDIFINQ